MSKYLCRLKLFLAKEKKQKYFRGPELTLGQKSGDENQIKDWKLKYRVV